MSVRHTVMAAPVLCLGLSGCVGINPVSAVVGMAGMAAANSAGMAQSSVISPQEQAKYASMSCADLRQLMAGYEEARNHGASVKKYGGMAPAGKTAIVNNVIGTRLVYLRQLVASKGC
ncbi:hypothetical protein EN943_17075 [Mesorhizobium sp. M7A.F.Ca.US.006.01.1.1]|uniref:hypothetical protein n=1 Tax=Mesorhizobium sp. M7A.F.Ca.US.006.01.1.1 TaxID=2496707 RepID=UPI000FCC6102|nr:hypothetical protein [Mesorhizobium sp. M7A.F.Ca.US.006.01.1.1]RUZ76483.1 hypothetical protein EN943_17075 [Mesorhizobium sp. M7A.F.Ca.US.006.01.1.1]